MVLGVRFDDEDPSIGDTLALRLRPGRLDAVAALAGPARAIACCGDDVVFIDARGDLRTLEGGRVLEDVIDLFEDGEGASLSGSPPESRLLALQGSGEVVDVVTGAAVLRVRGARSIRGGAVVTSDALYTLDGVKAHNGPVDVAASSGHRLAWAKGRNLVVDGRPFVLRQPAHALCFAFGDCFVSSNISGLSVVDEHGLRALRPSLRAHTLTVLNDGLLVVSDLMVATSEDGVDFISRDLASYVRLAEKESVRPSAKHAQQSP